MQRFKDIWKRFLSLPRWAQIAIPVAVVVVVVGAVWLIFGGSKSSDAGSTEPTVTLQSIGSFGGSTGSVDVLGTVQSVSEADLLAQSGGTVEAIHTTIGATVPAGFVIAELDSSSASAAVLQAQGGYDAALAAEQATSLQSQDSSGSFVEAQTAVRNLYQSDYSAVDSALNSQVSLFFGAETPVGPALLINSLTTDYTLPRERDNVSTLMDTWQTSLATANTTDPLTLLSNAQSTLTTISDFLTDLSNLASQQGSDASPAQLAALAEARSTVSSLLSGVSTQRDTYNSKLTAAEVGQTQSNPSADQVTSAQASVEEALGALRAAQAAYEKTVIRAPIGGTINYLPIHVGDYVSLNQHVATVARNNALEVVMYLSQDDRNRIAVGDTLPIADGDSTGSTTYSGVVTTIAPALDPVTKQIEVEVAVNDGSDFVNGQSVQVSLPTPMPTAPAVTASSTQSAASGTVLLPLTAVKLLPNERDVFSVDSTGHIVAHQVQIGDVIGDLIQVTTPLDPSLQIIVDARGLSAGDAVLVASSTAQTTE